MKALFPILIIIGLFTSCEGRRGSSNPQPEESTELPLKVKAPSKANVKIYFENTHSMDGYINGNTQFKDVFRELLVLVDNDPSIDFDTSFYLLNNELNKEDFGVETIKISERLSQKSTAKFGNKNSSDFEEVLNRVLQNHGSDDISILMADFIYSPKGESDIPSALNKLKTYTKNAFLNANSKIKDLETRVYRFSSDFNGIYYDINNKHIRGVKSRPYYYFVMAPKNLMDSFEERVITKLKNLRAYQNEIIFTTETHSSIPLKILTSTGNRGRFKTRSGEVEVIGYPKNGSLEITVLFDLHQVPVGQGYLLDKENYQLGNPEFTIAKIGLVDGKFIDFGDEKIKMSASTQLNIKNSNYTHAITYRADGLVSEDITMKLKKKIPSWVIETHSEDDRLIHSDTLEQTKTFGFGHLIEGVQDAYQLKDGNNSYFDIKIPVK